MPRFFVSPEAISEGKIRILEPDSRHISRSLRMAEGDVLTVCDGEGTDYLCRLSRIRDEECVCDIESSERTKSEPPIPVTLFMAYPKADKLEVVIQKSVELGVCSVVPFESERCIKRPTTDKAEKNRERHSRIAAEAAKQSGRGILPTVERAVSFSDMLASLSGFDLVLFCYEGEGAVSLRTVLSENPTPSRIAVIVGSEGGFSPEEARKICAEGAKCVNLGPRILRCETAPDYALSALSFFYEL